MQAQPPLLRVRDLSVAFDTAAGTVEAVRGVSFDVERGKTLVIVGESGSGKSVTAHALLGLNRGARVAGQALFANRDLLAMPERELRDIRGASIAMVFQNPHASLHPSYRIGWQVEEAMYIHEQASRGEARERAIDLLRLVGIADPEQRVDDYPYQLSGGMQQRAMIAMAMALHPRILIADEPTTALDVTVQAQILRTIRRIQKEIGMALVFITHDLGVVASIADDVIVMYAGRALEYAPRRTLLGHAHHPYTLGLLRSLPRADADGALLTPIRGHPPSAIAPPAGCPFRPRCDHATARCEAEQPLTVVRGDAHHRSACWLPD